MRDDVIKRLRTAEAIQALIEGRDRHHELLTIRKSHLATSWLDREKQVICKCGWFAFVSARRAKPSAVWHAHMESELSRPPRNDEPDESLLREVTANADFVLAGSYVSESSAWQAVSLLNRIDGDYRESLAARPPSLPPMPPERYLPPSALSGHNHKSDSRR